MRGRGEGRKIKKNEMIERRKTVKRREVVKIFQLILLITKSDVANC